MEELENNNIEAEEAQEEIQAEETTAEDTQEAPQELWKQTKQYEQGLWKTPDDIMQSVHYYEKKHQPLVQAIQKLGYKEISDFEQAFKDYQEKLPVYTENESTINLLNALLQDEVYGPKLKGTLEEIRRSQEVQRYGISFDELPPIIQERVQKGEQAFKQLEEMKQKQAYDENLNIINEQVEKIQALAKTYGYDANIPELIQYCQENHINPRNMYGEFLQHHFDKIVEKAQQNAGFAVASQNKQNKTASSSTKTAGAKPAKSISSENELEKAIFNAL